MNMSTSGKETQVSLAKQLIAGAKQALSVREHALTFGGASYTVSGLTTLLQSFVDLRAASDAAKATAKAQLIAERPSGVAARSHVRVRDVREGDVRQLTPGRSPTSAPVSQDESHAVGRAAGRDRREAQGDPRRAAHDGKSAEEGRQRCGPSDHHHDAIPATPPSSRRRVTPRPPWGGTSTPHA
jgi:hypothetical protein